MIPRRILLSLMASVLWAGTWIQGLPAQPAPPTENGSVPSSASGLARWSTTAALGPLSSRLSVLEGVTLQRGQTIVAEVELCSPARESVVGRVSILSTTAWSARPGRTFPFQLSPARACFQQRFSLALFEEASPGPYDLVLRVEAGGDELGTLRTRLVRPIEWLVIGPFAPVGPSGLLPPEEGIQLEGSHPGLEGAVRWQRPPSWAYDASGDLEIDLVLGNPTTPRCACAFTIFDVSSGETLRWQAPTADRLVLDGSPLWPGEAIAVTAGRHTLLTRVCTRGSDWSLGLALLRKDGTWPRTLENNLERFLPGFGDTWGKEDTSPSLRQVSFQVRQPAAREISILGSFNAWVPWRLERAGGGLWKRDLVLPPGRHAYKLRIDGVLTPNAAAERSEPDGFGGHNSLLIVR